MWKSFAKPEQVLITQKKNQPHNTMNKLTFTIFTIICLFLSGCDNPERSHLALDEGINLMFTYAQHEKAEEAFTKAIKYDGSNYEAYYYRGCSKFNRSLFKEAKEDMEKAIELKPNYADAEFVLGRIYFVMNDRDKACEYYKAAQQHGRDNLEDYVKNCP